MPNRALQPTALRGARAACCGMVEFRAGHTGTVIRAAAERAIRYAAEHSVDARASVIDAVRLLASPSERLDYERSLTAAGDAASELICMFCDDLYQPKNERFVSAFSSDELKELAHLHGLLCQAAQTPQPDVSAMLKTPAWRRVVAVAKGLSARLGSAAWQRATADRNSLGAPRAPSAFVRPVPGRRLSCLATRTRWRPAPRWSWVCSLRSRSPSRSGVRTHLGGLRRCAPPSFRRPQRSRVR